MVYVFAILIVIGLSIKGYPSEKEKLVPARCVTEVSDFSGEDLLALATPNMDNNAKRTTELSTKNLVARTPKREDLPSILEIFSDPKTVEHTWFRAGETPWNLRRVVEKYEAFAAEQLKGNRKDFAILMKDETGKNIIVGRCAIYLREDEKGQAKPGSWEFGITLHRNYQNKQIATELMPEIFKYVFTELNAKELWFETKPENVAMLHLYSKLGVPLFKDAKEDSPRGPYQERYHQYLLTKELWEKSTQR